MKFYIVTPTYNSLQWLPRCVRSVADQVAGEVEVHHHVQDGGSVDGTKEWLAEWQTKSEGIANYRFTYESAKDAGMYDAINKAWERMPEDADITAHLNSDEQYIYMTLSEVAEWMKVREKADVLLGTYLVTGAECEYRCHRRPVIPGSLSSWLNCTCITNSSFYRASRFRELRPRFDSKWRCVGDLVFFRELVWRKVRFETIPLVTSVFVCTGSNLAWTDTAHREWLELRTEAPAVLRWVNGFVYRWVNFKRRIVNLFMPAPRNYSAYLGDTPERTDFVIKHPTVRWKW